VYFEYIDFIAKTITRSKYIYRGRGKYMTLQRQTSRYKTAADGGMIKRVLNGDVEWSVQHPMFIF
jgi:hypothetical protein